MDVINATILRSNFSNAIDIVNSKRDYLFIAKRGKIVSALVNIDLFEDLLALSNKSYIKSIKTAREEYKNGNVLNHLDVFGEV